jgi:RNA polymerase sigma-70 factor, ECF subfamily
MANEVLEAFERCSQRYPTIQLPFEAFQSRVDAILSQEVPSPDEGFRRKAFLQIHHEDLFLAIACSRADHIAWEYFADDYFPILKQYALHTCGNASESEDLAQEITAKLMNEPNRLAGYNGRGSLAGWLRVAVSHAAIDRYRRRRREVSLEELQENGAQSVLVDPAKDGGEEDLDSRWGPVISGIVGEKISGLSSRDRLILGLHYLRGVSLKTIGLQFGIHEATVSRWLDRVRREIRKQVENELRKKHGLRAGEIKSLWERISISSVVGPISEGAAMDPGTNRGNKNECVPQNHARRFD